MKTFSVTSSLLAAIILALTPFMATDTGAQTSYPVVTPASSAGAATRAIVSINQSDIYNQIGNATNTANYAVNVGAGAQNTANYAVNVGSAAQGAADRASAEAANAGVVAKVGSANYQSGNQTQIWDFLCVKGYPPYNPASGFPPFYDIFSCPGGSGPYVLGTRGIGDQY